MIFSTSNCWAEQASLMKSALKPGYKFDQLLVLGILLLSNFSFTKFYFRFLILLIIFFGERYGHYLNIFLHVDTEGENLVLTAKYSLVNSSQQLPLEISQIRPYSIVHV